MPKNIRRLFFLEGIVVLSWGLIVLAATYYILAVVNPRHDPSDYFVFLQLFLAPISGVLQWILDHPEPITALATVAIGWFTWTLKRSTDKLWEEAKTSSAVAKQAADAAKDSADAATKSAEATQKSVQIMEAVEVARLTIKMSSKINVKHNSALVDWDVELTNAGRTPAGEIDVRWTIYDIVGAGGGYAEPEGVPEPTPTPRRYGDSLLPGEKLMIPIKSQIGNWDKVLARENSCIVHMQVSYRDIFGRAQVIPACFYYHHARKSFVGCPGARKTNQ